MGYVVSHEGANPPQSDIELELVEVGQSRTHLLLLGQDPLYQLLLPIGGDGGDGVGFGGVGPGGSGPGGLGGVIPKHSFNTHG